MLSIRDSLLSVNSYMASQATMSGGSNCRCPPDLSSRAGGTGSRAQDPATAAYDQDHWDSVCSHAPLIKRRETGLLLCRNYIVNTIHVYKIQRHRKIATSLELAVVRNDDAVTPSLDRDLRANASTKTGFRSKCSRHQPYAKSWAGSVIDALDSQIVPVDGFNGCLC